MKLRENLLRMQWVILAAALSLIGFLFVYDVVSDYQQTELRQADRLRALARLADDNLSQQLNATATVLRLLRDDLRRDGPQAIDNHRLAVIERAIPGIRTLVVVDATGIVRFSNRAELIGADAGRREFFIEARQQTDHRQLLLSAPYRTGLGVFSMNLSQVIENDRGGFAGAVVATLEPEYFRTLLKSLSYAEDMWAALAHFDGVQFMMVPEREGQSGKNLMQPGSLFSRHRDSGARESLLTGMAQATGESRMLAIRSVMPPDAGIDKPLVIAVGREVGAIFANWRRETMFHLLTFAFIALAATLSLAFSQRTQKARLSEAARVEARQRKLAATLAAAEKIADLGSWHVVFGHDGAADVWTVSDHLRRMFRLAPQASFTSEMGMSLVPEAERSRVAALWSAASRGEGPCEWEHPIVVDGETRWVFVRIDFSFDAEGRATEASGIALDITERKRAESRLREQDEEFHLILDHLPAAVASLDHELRLRFVNRNTCAWFGVEASAVVGRPVAELLGEEMFRRNLPLMQEALRGVPQRFERELRTGVGAEPRSVQVQYLPDLRDGELTGFYVFVFDISERVRIEAAVREAAQFTRGIIDALSAQICVLDADARILAVNEAWRAFAKAGQMRPEDSLEGANYFDVCDNTFGANSEGAAEFSAALQALLRGETAEFSLEYPCPSPSEARWLEVSASRFEIDGAACVVVAHEDITARKLVEEEIRRSNADLEQFAYAVSHDLRQPLRLVGSYLQLIERELSGRIDGEVGAHLKFAVAGAQRMDAMILGLLEYSRVGRAETADEKVDSRAVVDDVIALAAADCAAAGGTIACAGEWPVLHANRQELLRLLQNLLGNALKYRRPECPPQVTIQSRVEDGIWRVSVSDNGIGIDPSQTHRLFKVFSRLQPRSRFEGSGIGLALCRRIVERYNGFIWAESSGEGSGATFRFSMPVVDQASGAPVPLAVSVDLMQ
jgi:PAS domain S-box-containing protein